MTPTYKEQLMSILIEMASDLSDIDYGKNAKRRDVYAKAQAAIDALNAETLGKDAPKPFNTEGEGWTMADLHQNELRADLRHRFGIGEGAE